MAQNAPKDSGSKTRDVASCAAARNGDNRAEFEETWKAWEHQVDVYGNLAELELDDDVNISVLLREAPATLREFTPVRQKPATSCEQSSKRSRTRTRVGLRMTSEVTRWSL